jgi:hypothetical protein
MAAMLFTSGCSQNVPEEDTINGTEGEVTEEVTEGAVKTEGEGGYNPVINPDDFVEVIDNPYFPLTPGTTFVYEGESED